MGKTTIKNTIGKIQTGDNIEFPWTAPSDGMLMINLHMANISAQYVGYLYLKRNSESDYIGTVVDEATGGQHSMCFAVQKGDVITGTSAYTGATHWEFLPFY